eukprot:1482633-Amphidinium_carterae.1
MSIFLGLLRSTTRSSISQPIKNQCEPMQAKSYTQSILGLFGRTAVRIMPCIDIRDECHTHRHKIKG